LVDSPAKRRVSLEFTLYGNRIMLNESNDKGLLQKVNQRLARTASGGRTRVTATIRKGDVTLTGTLQYEIQRKNYVRAASSTPGVRRVIDQMTVEAKKPKGV
jgi:osmotically-inducible protein OsmY